MTIKSQQVNKQGPFQLARSASCEHTDLQDNNCHQQGLLTVVGTCGQGHLSEEAALKLTAES